MAKKKVTPHNTGISISRKGSKFTANWTIKAKDVEKQVMRYRTYNWSSKKWGAWTKVKLTKGQTHWSIKLDPTSKISSLQIQICILRKDEKKDGKVVTQYTISDWDDCSAKYEIKVPPTPGLSVTAVSANKSTFTITDNSSDTNHAWQRAIKYRTKLGTGAWTSWADTSSTTYTYEDSGTGQSRIFQIKAVGTGRETKIVERRHYIGGPPAMRLRADVDCKALPSGLPSYYKMIYLADLSAYDWTVDKIVPQYYIGVPTTSALECTGVTFTDGQDYSYDDAKRTYKLAINTSDIIGPDECLWARVKTDHDGIEAASNVVRVRTGRLKAPSCTISMSTPTSAGFTVSVTINDAGTTVPGTYAEVYLEKASASGTGNYILLGTIANGTSSASISSTIDLTSETGYAIHVRNVSADGSAMTSDYDSYVTTMPTAPTLNDVKATTVSGKVRVEWTNNWNDATGTIIAWTDDPDNWTSNDEPETYEVTEKASAWYITGIETGKVWYFRIRSVKRVGDEETLSPWSADKAIDLASAPAMPTLYLSEEAITEEGMVTAYWSYVTTDGTAQVSGTVVQGTVSGGVFTPTKVVGVAGEEQHVDIYAQDWGWTNGSTVYLALQTGSGSGGVSDYSAYVELAIAAKPTVSITSTSLAVSETIAEQFLGDGATTVYTLAGTPSSVTSVKVNGTAAAYTRSGDEITLGTAPADGAVIEVIYTTSDDKVLTAMPLTMTVTPTNVQTITVAIERAADYPMDRPDGTYTEGAEGETVYLNTVPAEATAFTINESDLFAHLDDGALYNIVVTVVDQYGQKAEARQRFIVHWSHQAWEPTATITVDKENYIAEILPVAGADYVLGDTCDIYRLSNDKPELIYKGALFGTTYVDPYPAFTGNGGYKIVTVTANGDYITPDDKIADVEYITDLDPGTLVIDFAGNRVELPYNITLTSSWAKDHKRTVYLGGSVVGDYNKAVTRDVNAGTALIRNVDEATAAIMHELAAYTHHGHVRTPDGSSFEADVQVQENRAHNSAAIDYVLTVQKTDTTGFDAMTQAEWNYLQNEESS